MKFSPYIYEPDKSLEVYKETEVYFNENSEVKQRIEELGWVYQTLGFVIPQNVENLWSGHYFPFVDSFEELQVSFTQICFGLYKQAFVSLRTGLELGLLSVYFNINDEGHETVKNWLQSKEDTPRTSKIWRILRQDANIKKFDTKHDLEQVHKDLGYLHNYVHTKGAKYSNRMGLQKSNFQTFEKGLIEKWLKSYSDIISLICALHLLKYPISVIQFDWSKKFGIDIPSFGGLEEWQINKIASILPKNYMKDIEIIAIEDEETQEIIKEIDSFPDMTDERLEEQILDWMKISIEHGEGFNKWLERKKSELVHFGKNDFDSDMKEKIEILRKWAIENDFLESKKYRLKNKKNEDLS